MNSLRAENESYLLYVLRTITVALMTTSSCCLVTKSYLILCDPMDYSQLGSSVHGILQARILEWIAISFSRGSSQPRDRTHISCVGRQILYCWATRKVLAIMTRDWINIYWINDLKWLISILFLCLSEVNFKYRIISVVPLTLTNLSSSRVLYPS